MTDTRGAPADRPSIHLNIVPHLAAPVYENRPQQQQPQAGNAAPATSQAREGDSKVDAKNFWPIVGMVLLVFGLAVLTFGKPNIFGLMEFPPDRRVVQDVDNRSYAKPLTFTKNGIRYTGSACARSDGSIGREGYSGTQLGCWRY